MPLGWIDFSKSERSQVLGVLDMLTEPGTLDELGIAPVRDGFADMFFPGTSTIQTRAKYFLIVPYVLKELEGRQGQTAHAMLNELDRMEWECGKSLWKTHKDTKEIGIIGGRSLPEHWVKRTPSTIYWSGLRRFGIFRESLSLAEYALAVCKQTEMYGAKRQTGKGKDDGDGIADDWNAVKSTKFWNLPPNLCSGNWRKHLSIYLTYEEGVFLKERILENCGESLLACILREDTPKGREIILGSTSFSAFAGLSLPRLKKYQMNMNLAASFSHFVYVLRIVYNLLAFDGKNAEAEKLWESEKTHLPKTASVNLEDIFQRLSLAGPKYALLDRFLKKSREQMDAGNLEGIKRLIQQREILLKGRSRAKTVHPLPYKTGQWVGGKELDYRFSNAKTILRDIFESEGTLC